MIIKSLEYRFFRNYEHLFLNPDEGVNVITGDNAQGKTNLIEGIWLFTGCRSFRTRTDMRLVKTDSEASRIKTVFTSSDGENEEEITIDKNGRSAVFNGVKVPSMTSLFGKFRAVVFSPVMLSLVQQGPEERRKFVDITLCELDGKYARALAAYNRSLVQRNALLKDVPEHPELADMLDAWDSSLCEAASYVTRMRRRYISLLAPKAAEVYSGISSRREKLDIGYVSRSECVTPADFYTLYQNTRDEDISRGSTQNGPHRDDLSIDIDTKAARVYGSQGQQRSAALALKLAEGLMIKDASGEDPVVLLDDVMSELDRSRRDFVLNHISGRQVFITCCDPQELGAKTGGRVFTVKDGKVVS